MPIILLTYLLGLPLVIMLLAKRWSWIDKVSPMTILYIIGLLVGNFIPLSKETLDLNSTIGNIAVPVAIPLMLMACNLKKWSTKKAVKAFLCGLVSVLIVSFAGFFLFHQNNDTKEFAQVCAVAAGIYTGGIPNASPIAKGVGMSEELYLYVSSYDLIVTGLYLIFVIFFGKTFFRKILPAPKVEDVLSSEKADNIENQDSKPPKKASVKQILWVLGITLAIVGIAYFVSTLVSSDGSVNMTVLILTLTTLSIGASFLKPIQEQEQSFDMGLYCVYVFCLSIATACNVSQMDLLGSLSILGYLFFVIFGSIVLQLLFARLLKIDGDTVMVSSVALINSPPFVPMAAALLGNKEVLMIGISIGLLGYMLGNYLGIGLFQLLMLLG